LNFAKPCIDLGLNTASGETMLQFWREQVGLTYEGPLLIRRGVTQHRFECDRSIIKVNVHASALDHEPASGYRELLVAKPGLDSPLRLQDPDGNLVCLWPAGVGGLNQIGVRLSVRDLSRHRSYYGEQLGLEEHASPFPSSACFAVGRSRLIFEEDPDAAIDAGFGGAGWRYITLQVVKVDEVHSRLLAGGAREAMAPRTLGTTARVSMVLDPDGNWIELSQRASLVGSLT
jgi:lactoylglutathione lyase